MSADMAAALPESPDNEIRAIDAGGFAPAHAESGAIKRLAIKKTASSRHRWIERVTRDSIAQSGP